MGRKTVFEVMQEEVSEQQIMLRAEEIERDVAELIELESTSNSRRMDRFFGPVRITENRLLLIENQEIAQVAKELSSYGITEELIREKWRSQIFSKDHRSYFTSFDSAALIFLVSGKAPELFLDRNRGKAPELPESLHLIPEAALEQINGFCFDKLRALVWLYSYGLRAHHFRDWRDEKGSDMFMLHHSWALETLVIDGGKTVEEALFLLQGKSEIEVSNIRKAVEQQTSDFSKTSGQKECPLTSCHTTIHHSSQRNFDENIISDKYAVQVAKIINPEFK